MVGGADKAFFKRGGNAAKAEHVRDNVFYEFFTFHFYIIKPAPLYAMPVWGNKFIHGFSMHILKNHLQDSMQF